MNVDAIIIGSGIAGLVAAATLSKNGKRVFVFEQHSIPGGYATTFKRKEMIFDVSLHVMGDIDESGMVRKMLEEIGVIPDLKFHKAKILYKSIFSDTEIVAENYDSYLENLSILFPEERKKIKSLFDMFIQIREEILILNDKSLKGEIINSFECAKSVAKYLSYSLKDMLDEYLESPKLKAIISQYWEYFSLPPSKLSVIYYAYVWTEYFIHGGYYPDNRSQALSNKLVEIIKKNDGEVFTNSEVKKIEIKDNKAVGIELKNGEEYYSDNIISNCNLKETFENMVGYEHLNKRYVKRINNIIPSLSSVQIHLTLDIDFSKVYNEHTHEVFVNDNYDIEKSYLDVIEGNVNEAPFIITIYDNIIKEYNEQGKSTLSIFQLSNYENWSGLDKAKYKKEKERIFSSLINRMNKLYPGFSEHIAYFNVSTPITNERYTKNTKGAIYGAAMTVNQVIHKRLPQETPIKNLFLAGAWTRPSCGYNGCIWSGYNVAKLILREEEKNDRE